MDKTAKEWKKEAKILEDQYKFENAIECYDKAIELDPEDPYPWYSKGLLITYSSGEFYEAIECLDKAIGLDPSYEEAWKLKGNVLNSLVENSTYKENVDPLDLCKDAIECFNKAIELNPEDSDAWTGKGIALFYIGEKNDAIKCLDKALEIDSENNVALNCKSSILAEKGDYKNAMKCINKSLDIDPEDIETLKIKEQIIRDSRTKMYTNDAKITRKEIKKDINEKDTNIDNIKKQNLAINTEDRNDKIIKDKNDDTVCIFTVDKDVYKRFHIIKAQFSAKKRKSQTWDEFFYELLGIERRYKDFKNWLYTVGMFFITTFILAFPFYLGNPIMAIWMMPIFLIIGFIFAYTIAYIFTLYPMKGMVPFNNPPPKILEHINDLSKKACINKPIKLLISESPEANAMTYSNIKEHKICLTRGTVDAYENGKIDDDELRSILGHEIGHIANLDTLKSMLTLSFVCIFDLLGEAMIFIGRGMGHIGRKVSRNESSDTGGIIGLVIIFIGWSMYITGVVQRLIAKAVSAISLKVSRNQEYAADIVGAELTSPETMSNALKKIMDLDKELIIEDIEPLPYSDRWQVEPVNRSWIDKLFDDHPSMKEREEKLMEINKYL